MFKGLRSTIYPAPDLDAQKAWFTKVLGKDPYFDEPFYVGFEVGGFELGLAPGAESTVTYWGVDDADAAYSKLVEAGGAEHEAIHDVGGGIRLGAVKEPGGAIVGVIDNPHFKG